MPYYTLIPDATIDLNAETPVISLGNSLILNELSGSTEFDQYDVGSPGATTLQPGDTFTTSGGGAPLSGTYAGSGTVSTAAAGVTVPNPLPGLPPLASLTVQLNPIDADYMVDGNGNVYLITEEPFDQSHLGVTVSGSLSGIPLVATSVPISQLGNVLPVGPVLNAVQSTLDTVVVNTAYDPNGTLPLDAEDVTCFVAGTLIETKDGLVSVEDLKLGDLIATRDNGYQPIRWIGSVKLSPAALATQPKLRPIRIKAGALGDNTPSSDLLVSPQHRVLVRSKVALKMFGALEVLVAAKQLLQIEGVDVAADMESVEYFHFLFDRHEVVHSNGAATESLYTGAQALKSVGKAAREEIFALFPQLRDADFTPEPARPMPSGRKARKLANRHLQHDRAMVC
ncbi:Hint domain-containing protein [Paracoccus aminovorans]|uniref:Hint domain-containing protein n=1 Tax=Paracoccus aminovorans TaxID=34004 RepID=A0A1I3BNH7_9RHOB|nr:Hint domain-containing protein [Paracoccus aminovorans]CQR86832.1 hypothetical protein JCM7685_2277 [Paracoccus aminovorans]SFH63845.1 Hint domain-containing protein [Paracoccus aminovorans]